MLMLLPLLLKFCVVQQFVALRLSSYKIKYVSFIEIRIVLYDT